MGRRKGDGFGEGAVDTLVASWSPWPAGGPSWTGNPAAPPGSASGQGTTVGPMRGASPSSQAAGCRSPSAGQNSPTPTPCRGPVRGACSLLKCVLSAQFKATKSTPRSNQLHPTGGAQQELFLKPHCRAIYLNHGPAQSKNTRKGS